MPKSKYGPALFEVFDKGNKDDPHKAKGEKSRSISAFRATLSSLVSALGGNATASEAEEEARPRTAMSIHDGRVHIALTSRGAGLAIFLALLGACLAFAAGQWYGRQTGLADGRKLAQASIQRAALDEIERARKSPPVRGLFAGIGESPVKPVVATDDKREEQEPVAARLAAAPAASPAIVEAPPSWVKGSTYVVVQSFRGDAKQDAIRAKEFLAQHGIGTDVFGDTVRGFKLIATKGFNRKDATQRDLADLFLRKIKEIGEAYYDAGGRYKLEGYFATLKADTW